MERRRRTGRRRSGCIEKQMPPAVIVFFYFVYKVFSYKMKKKRFSKVDCLKLRYFQCDASISCLSNNLVWILLLNLCLYHRENFHVQEKHAICVKLKIKSEVIFSIVKYQKLSNDTFYRKNICTITSLILTNLRMSPEAAWVPCPSALCLRHFRRYVLCHVSPSAETSR